ncbi:MAG: hypothetical protein NZM35_02195 [Chitinophagales bacterium]|nr:hypothetical protein [Chitinophagales bacterium]MDW8418288.1 hypothetical protein [Chitinophagales bacterium]
MTFHLQLFPYFAAMKKYWLQIIILVALLLAAGAALYRYVLRPAPDFEKELAIEDTRRVNKITIENYEQKRLLLEKINGVWRVNGRYEARPELIQMILTTLQRQRVLAPVPRSAHDNVMREMMAKYIKVTVSEEGSMKPVKVFYVGGATTDNKASYMLLEKDGKPAERPVMVYLPSHSGYLTPIYADLDEERWRNRIVLSFTSSALQSLEVNYVQEPQNSFRIVRVAADSFVLHPLQEPYRLQDNYVQRYIHQYLDFYNSVSVETFDNANKAKDTIINGTPYCLITARLTDGTTQHVRLHYMPINERSQTLTDKYGMPLKYDAEHYYAVLNDGKDLAIVQYYVFGKLLRSYRDFFYKP